MSVTHTLPTNYDTNGTLYPTHSLIAGGGHTVGQTTGAPMYTISAWTSYSNPMFWYDVSDQKWYDNNAPDAEPVYIVGTNTFSVPTSGWGEVTIANPRYVYIGNQLNGSGFQMGFESPYWTSSGPTVTSITVNEPRLGPYNTGVGPDYYLDGTVVSNDTIVASDITLYKDDQLYSSSNITMHGNSFEINFNGSAHYTIQCGGQTAFVTYEDESWRNTITSNSSQRSTNVVRIRNILSTIPQDLNLFIRYFTSQSQAWSTWHQHAAYSQRIQSNTWVEWRHEQANFIEIFKFTLGNVAQNATNPHLYDVLARISIHKWDKNDPSDNPTMYHTPWTELGASYRGEIRSGVGHNNPAPAGATYGSSAFHDPNYQQGAGAQRSYQLMVHDWVFYAQQEGDDEGPDGNPPNNEPPSTGDGDTNNDGSDDPKHQYPGDKYNSRRRRAHSFW